MEKTIFSTITFDDLTLTATVYMPEQSPKGIILYFHGGGLVYGYADDLPDVYVKILTDAGYAIVSFDYPLAPEVKIDQILSLCQQQIEWFLNHEDKIGALNNSLPLFLMGRSAGAFIALKMIAHYENIFSGLISFYGYYQLDDATFLLPSRYYLQLKEVSDVQFNRLVQDQPVIAQATNHRYLIYLYARQKGKWQELLLPESKSASDFKLSQDQLKDFPPTFIAAATGDPDVPIRQSKQMANLIPENEAHFVQANEHDFDRTEVKTLGVPMYEKLIEWLDRQI